METVRVRWHGHSCFEIATDEISVVTDPHDGKSLGIRPPRARADVVLVSHGHFDHAAVRAVEKPGATRVVDTVDAIRLGPLMVRGVPTFHDANEGASRGANIVFVFSLGDVTFCHLGDLGHMLNDEQARAIGPVDVLFVPVGGVFTIDAQGAKAVIDLLSPKVVVPMHYRVGGLSLSINDLSGFISCMDPSCVVKVGNVVEFTAADLEEEQLVWIFTF